MSAPYRLRASHVRVDVDERSPTGAYQRLCSLLVDWTGYVQITSVSVHGRRDALLFERQLDALRELGLVEMRPTGPEDSEPFLTEKARELFAHELGGLHDAVQDYGSTWHDWDP